MSANGRARDGRARAIGAWGATTILVAGLVASCGIQPAPTRQPIASPPPSAVSTASPVPAYADTLRVSFGNGGGDFGISFDYFRRASGTDYDRYHYLLDIGSVVYSRLYRYDAAFNAVPDLADGPCEPRGDGTVIRCRLIETTFHDGTPLTADDVAYTYEVYQRDLFYAPGATGTLQTVSVVDPRTVDFTLEAVDPTFLTNVLPIIPIVPRHAIEAAYEAFHAGTSGLEAAGLSNLADAIDDETSRDPPVCAPRLGEVADLLARIGVKLYREDFARGPTGSLDSCAYMQTTSGFLRQTAVALGAAGLDAVAAAFQLLSTDWRPIGTGPYRLMTEDAKGIHLEAWPGYQGAPAATRFIDFVPSSPDGSDVSKGAVDIFQIAWLGPGYAATAGSRGVRIATPHLPQIFDLTFNVRPGRVFADGDLRRALQLCIDLPRDVDAAAPGDGAVLTSPVIPGTWAADPSIAVPARDTAAARRLIEDAGWRIGEDLVYAKDSRRLAAEIPVRADDPERTKMADLISTQARDCGMDLRAAPTAWGDLRSGFFEYPHLIPGTSEPFDVYLGGWKLMIDPGDLGFLRSSQVTDAEHQDLDNIGGFADPTFDGLVTAANATYEQRERAQLYRRAQQELAAQLPVIWLWEVIGYDVVSDAVTTMDGPLDLDAPNWAWQPERMVVAPP